MSSWTLQSIPPHDWFLCLDVNKYFDHEHEPEKIYETGFTRPVPVGSRDVVVTTFFNGDPEQPEFHCKSPAALDKDEVASANKSLSRILGTNLDLRPLYEQAADDPVLGPKLTEFYGLKRMARANLFEDTLNRIITMRLSHKPTAKKMVFKVRENYGTMLQHEGEKLPAWPRPRQLVKAAPIDIRKLGPTKRKGEFIIGFAEDLLSGEQDLDYLENCDPETFYQAITEVRGIGPTSARQLMMFREQTDAYFVPQKNSKGNMKGHRKWIAMSYGKDPDAISEKAFQQLIAKWKGYEAAALEFLYLSWILSEKKKKADREDN